MKAKAPGAAEPAPAAAAATKKKKGGKKGSSAASGLEALLSLASAAENEGPKDGEANPQGAKRPRPPDNANLSTQQRKRGLQRGGLQPKNLANSSSSLSDGPGYCGVGRAPPMHRAKHCTRHVAIAYYIYYQQRKSMMQCVGPSGKAVPVSLDPTLEARLLKERTEWMKRNNQPADGEGLNGNGGAPISLRHIAPGPGKPVGVGELLPLPDGRRAATHSILDSGRPRPTEDFWDASGPAAGAAYFKRTAAAAAAAAADPPPGSHLVPGEGPGPQHDARSHNAPPQPHSLPPAPEVVPMPYAGPGGKVAPAGPRGMLMSGRLPLPLGAKGSAPHPNMIGQGGPRGPPRAYPPQDPPFPQGGGVGVGVVGATNGSDKSGHVDGPRGQMPLKRKPQGGPGGYGEMKTSRTSGAAASAAPHMGYMRPGGGEGVPVPVPVPGGPNSTLGMGQVPGQQRMMYGRHQMA